MTTFSQLLSSLRNVTVLRFITALERDGFVLFRNTRGSHRVYYHADGRAVVIPFHKRGATLTRRTLRSVLVATKWNEDDAVRLGLRRR